MNTVILQPLQSPVQREARVPGSKSYTIRALLLAALTPKSPGEAVRIVNPLLSDDTQAIMGCLNALGLRIDLIQEADALWLDVHGSLQAIANADYQLDANLSAATLRFLLAVSAVIPGRQTLFGKEGLNKRPVRDLVDSLRAVGADIEYLDEDGYPPVRVKSNRLGTRRIQVSGSTSSQYISALMMIAPLMAADGGAPVEIILPGEPVSKPYLDMTMAIMDAFQVSVSHQDYQRFKIAATQTYRATQYTVEPDASSMAYFLAIATLTGSTVTIPKITAQSAQADMRFVEILTQMGSRVAYGPNGLTLQGHGVKPLRVDMRDCPDQAQTLAVLAAFANGTTRIDGLQSLRVKETDRIAAVAQELQKMGIDVDAEPDALVIHGGNPQAASIATYGDHRMAMAFAVAGAQLAGLQIEEPAVVNKTYPEFWQDLQRFGVSVQTRAGEEHASMSPRKKIVLIGFMGAGKSSVASLLAEQLRWQTIEMDALIVERSGYTSVNAIFENDGEIRFRELELDVARTLQTCENAVISTGGGVIMNKLTMDYLAKDAAVVFLDTRLDTVRTRLEGNADRPLLRNPAQVQALFELRQPLYRHYAHHTIATDSLAPADVAQQIAQAGLTASLCTV